MQPVEVIAAGVYCVPLELVSYAPPSISSLVGCESVINNGRAVQNCNRTGGQVLTILGQDFGMLSLYTPHTTPHSVYLYGTPYPFIVILLIQAYQGQAC